MKGGLPIISAWWAKLLSKNGGLAIIGGDDDQQG